jgi:hypothetical protein
MSYDVHALMRNSNITYDMAQDCFKVLFENFVRGADK